jgi:hypothetical protein
LNAPLFRVLHEPVYKRTPLIDNLTVKEYLCVLNSSDQRPSGRYVDLDSLESHEHDFPWDLFERQNERIDSQAAMVAPPDLAAAAHRNVNDLM